MGLIGDIFKSTTVMEYKADVDQAKIAIRDLAGEQKKQAQAAVTGIEDQIKAHERVAAKIAITAGIVGGAITIGVASWKKYEESSRLAAATTGANMEQLRVASHHLLTDLELMAVAAAGMNGKWKLTSDEMARVLGAAVALENKGLMPLGQAVQKLGEALRKGEIDPLKELGVVYDENLAKTDKRAAAVQALTDLSNSSAAATSAESEAMRQHATSFKDSVDKISAAIGGLVNDLAPLIEAVAKLVEGARGLGHAAWQGGLDSLDSIGSDLGIESMQDPTKWTGENDIYYQFAAGQAAIYNDWVRSQPMYRDGDQVKGPEAERRRAAEAARIAAIRAQRKIINDAVTGNGDKPKPKGRGGGGYSLNAATTDGQMYNFQLGEGEDVDRAIEAWLAERLDFGELGTEASDALAADAQGSTREKPSILSRLFGPPEEIDHYAEAWHTLESAVTAGYEALVTGSESAGKAMKRVIAQAIMAEGSRMLVLALREGAEAIAALASYNYPAAAAHGLAAAKYAAGAAAAGVIASSLGAGGGGGAPAGAGAGASAAGAGARAPIEQAPQTRIFVLGDSFGDESDRSRALRFNRIERRARGYESTPTGVEYN